MAHDETLLGRPTEPDAVVAFWLKEIKDARTREKAFRKDGETILKIYDGTNQAKTPFNILFSNTETLLPAIYSAVPRPIVSRRFKDDDPLGKAAADASTRMLEFLLDTNLHEYDAFDVVMRHNVLDALLPGRGMSCVKYMASITGLDEESDAQEDATDSSSDATEVEESPTPEVTDEMICLETKGWSRAYFGYAKKWSKVPWVAFEEYVDKPEAIRLFGKEMADKIVFSNDEPMESEDARSKNKDEHPQGALKTACLYQIWDRQGGRRVIYVSPQYPDGILKEEDDPLQLSGFFPCPKPLAFIEKTHSLIPTALYKIYENQATELNNIQLRLNNLVKACKARGIYDSGLGDDLQKLMSADENALVPAQSASSLAADKGLQNAIWFMPLDVIQSTLQSLYAARESCKQVIYEITGISDILRGASQASETATAQQIKNQWGTLRLKRLQKAVAAYARDLLRLMVELAASKLSEESWAKMTGLPFLTTMQVQQATAMLQAMQEQMQANPQMQQQMLPQLQQVQQQLKTPQWAKVLSILQNDLTRAYRIDIETNSTVEPEAAEDQKNITELMSALGQYLNGVGPLVAKGVMPFGVAQHMLIAISRRFRFGNEIEDDLKAMKEPKPDEAGKQEAQAKQQFDMQKLQADQQQFQAKLQADQQQAADQRQAEMQQSVREHELALAQIQATRETTIMEIEAKKQSQLATLNAQRQTDMMRTKMEQETELKKATLQAATQIELANLTQGKDAAQVAAESIAEGAQTAQTADVMAKILEQQDAMMQAMMVPKAN